MEWQAEEYMLKTTTLINVPTIVVLEIIQEQNKMAQIKQLQQQ